MVHRLIDQYGSQVKYVWRHFPLPNHQYSIPGAEAVEAAGEQGKFWEMLDALYSHGGNINDQIIQATAQGLGLDMNKFQASMNGHAHLSLIRADLEEGKQRGINATPHFNIGPASINGLPQWDTLNTTVQQELAKTQ
jgi:protein-disulfide isomerase